MVIDDEPHLRITASQTLELAGYTPYCFESAEQALAALPCRAKAHVQDAANLILGVAHGVECFLFTGKRTVWRHAPAARLTKINVAGQLADDEDVQARDQLRFEAGGVDQFFVTNGRTEIGEQTHVFSQTQNRLLGAQGTVQGVVFPIADRTKKHCIGLHGQLQGGVGQWVTVCVVGSATDQGRLGFDGQAQSLEHLEGLVNDFGTNAVTRQHSNLHA